MSTQFSLALQSLGQAADTSHIHLTSSQLSPHRLPSPEDALHQLHSILRTTNTHLIPLPCMPIIMNNPSICLSISILTYIPLCNVNLLPLNPHPSFPCTSQPYTMPYNILLPLLHLLTDLLVTLPKTNKPEPVVHAIVLIQLRCSSLRPHNYNQAYGVKIPYPC